MKKVIGWLIFVWVFVATSAQGEIVSVVEAIKIKNNKRAEALFYYENNWKRFRLIALEKGYIHSFELVETTVNQTEEFDILLITKYLNQTQQDKAEERFRHIIDMGGELKLLNELKPREFRESVFVNIGQITQNQSSIAANPVKDVVMEGLARPWSMAFLSENEALISEKDGHLLKVNLSTKQKAIIKNFPKDLAQKVTVDASKYDYGIYPTSLDGRTGSFNMGIFDVILDPEFRQNHFVYIAYSAKQKDTFTTKVIRAELKGERLANIKNIFIADPYTPGAWHFGGGMTFGGDGKLYITVGERLFNEMNQPSMPIAQNIKDKRGKIHRINSDGSIPRDNPYIGKEPIDSIYALGIRAAQGLTLEPSTGNIWFTEHGTNQGDEINILTASANYGWPIKTTGTYRYADYKPPELTDRTFNPPIWYWRHTVAPTGLTFYTGDEFPTWKNDLFISGLSRGSLWRVRTEGNTVKSVEELFVNDRVRSRKVIQSPEGRLYILTDESNGRIIRIRNVRQ